MQFLPDVYVPCEVCKGKRYNREALEIHYKGRSIADVLEMTVDEALEFFAAGADRRRRSCGRSTTSGSATSTSASRRRPCRAARRSGSSSRPSCRGARPGKTLYVLDEPTTGLHFADVEKLLQVLHRLVDAGNTVLVIEHNLDVIKTADWIVDLGPEGGARGGRIIAEGTPEEVAGDRGLGDRRVPGPGAARRAARAALGRHVRRGGRAVDARSRRRRPARWHADAGATAPVGAGTAPREAVADARPWLTRGHG